jgi:nitrite reductase/ring-hydroxylating ferredoxin subunit
MGCSLAEGTLDGGQVKCPCHGSHFRVTDGQVTQGPAAVAEPVFDVRPHDGRLQIRQRTPTSA